MKRAFFTLLAVMVILVAPTAFVGKAVANDRDFTIVNGTDDVIDGLWLSTRDSDTWYAVSHFQNLEPGDSTKITFDESGKCQVQVRIHLDDGTAHEWPAGFNLCKVRKIKIYQDNQGNYQAEYE